MNGGIPLSPNSLCQFSQCPIPVINNGSCCLPNNTCNVITELNCIQNNGTFQGNFTICNNTCGSCCYNNVNYNLREENINDEIKNKIQDEIKYNNGEIFNEFLKRLNPYIKILKKILTKILKFFKIYEFFKDEKIHKKIDYKINKKSLYAFNCIQTFNDNCNSLNGTFSNNTLCSQTQCPILPIPTGSCCQLNGTCIDGITNSTCLSINGI